MTAARVVIGAALVVGLGCRARPDEPAAATVAVASDAGGAEPRAIDPPAAVDALAPALVAIDGGALATWLEPIAGGHRLQVARWQGGAWSAPVTISAGAAIVASWADVPTLGVAGDGALVASWTEATGPEGYDAIVARSIDGGATWMRLGPLHGDHTATEHGFVAIAADGAGARAFWLDGRATATGGATALRTARVDGRVTDETVLDARVCDCCATAAAASAAGPIVAFRDRSPADLRDVVVASPDADGWRATGAAVDGWEITGCPVNGPALAARARTVATAWYTAAGGVPRVRAAFSGDGGATFAAAIDLDAPTAARVPLGRVAIVLAGDDAVASWVAAAGDDAAIWLRRVAADGRLGAARAIATLPAARTAGTPRLARVGEEIVLLWSLPGVGLRALAIPDAAVPALGAPARLPVAARRPVPGPGDPAPAIVATDTSGAAVSLAALRGRVVLLNLWATWCEPCRAELPVLMAIARRHRDRGLVVVGLDVDRDRTPAEVAAFAARRGMTAAIWLDPDERNAARLGATTYPVNLLIDRAGVIRWRRDGAVTPDDADLRAAIEAALR